MSEAIAIHQLTVNYDKTSALWDVNVSIPTGTLVGIIGPNGAGKSTLLQALIGLVRPLSGSVHFFGEPFAKVRQQIAYIPQKGAIDWDFPITVFDAVLMGRYGHLRGLKWYRKADKEAVWDILKRLDMSALARRQISALSGGQQQRLFLARALLQESDVLLFDEPFSAVDQRTEEAIIGILQDLKERGKTILVVHHDLKTVSAYFDRALLMNTSLIAFGKTEEVLTGDNLARAYGQKGEIFSEATRLARVEESGLSP